MKYSVNDLKYGGTYHEQFWNKKNNPNADIENALGNCTTAVYGFCLVENDPIPVSKIVSASHWHEFLINDWKCVDFDESQVKIGDIIQWVEHCHVAKVADIRDGVIYLNGSFYTGDHGKAYYNNGYDTRSFETLDELSRFMETKYPDRLYHYWALDKESQMVGGQPEHILVRPMTLFPVDEDPSKNQIQTTETSLRIRAGADLQSEIIGHVSVGFYDVISIAEASEEDRMREPELKCWYQIAKDRWIANLTTIYHEGSGEENPAETIQRCLNTLTATITKLTNESKAKDDLIALIHEMTKPKGE